MNNIVSEHEEHPLSLTKYIIGFIGSVAVTMAAYLLVTRGGVSRDVTIGIISTLAVVQFIVQMVFFLHVADERKPRFKLMVMGLMLLVVLIVVVGSIWIMHNMNYRMTPQQEQQYLKSQDSI